MSVFARLPVHQKLVVMALAVTTVALLCATIALVSIDVWRYRTAAFQESDAIAAVIAENTAAAVSFDDKAAALASLETVRLRPTVRRACLYLANGSLFAGFSQPAVPACPGEQPEGEPPQPEGWDTAAGTANVTSGGRIVGTVYVERTLSEIRTIVVIGIITGFVVLLVSAGLAYVVAQRLHRSVSSPIAQLAAAAKAIPPDGSTLMPAIPAGEDEIGDLVRAFGAMVERVQHANAEREELLTREREANRLKDEFLAAVSHELRTPLNAIVGWIQILSMPDPPVDTRTKAMASLERNAQSLTRVIEDLVDTSRAITGKLTLKFDNIDLREIVESALDAVKPAAVAKDIHLKVVLPAGPVFVSGDRDRLQQVVWNLAANAVKFTPAEGTVTVELAQPRAQDVTLEVRDTGMGIPAHFLPHVFDRFRQADGSMTREHGGLGLGLAIVKELVEMHGGSVAATSAGEGRGAAFIVRLPASGRTRTARPGPVADTRGAQALAGLHVLGVDDNEDALELLSTTLRAHGARVTTVRSGAEALSSWEADPADVVVCDLAMPHMDGFEVLERLRALQRRSKHPLAAIALSAHVADAYTERTKKAGFQYHMGKPYSADQLIDTIRRAAREV